ncbi:MAG TPA: amidohydrolase [Flavobacterium sp.]|uniref:amidohydrolase n=1 Tax=Flavobacterium sp. TaxID=239 RepID=UPI002C184FE9|nr:amidohydrolase [Flavobacterium sp.]HNP32659.1 amidohydrolase [Flavobacterium sp.]
MKVALIQTSLIWENPLENRSHLAQKITGFMEDVDLIVLPEMFSSGFTMDPKSVAEKMDGETVSWLQHLAKAKDCAITGSLVIEEAGSYYNRLLFVYPSGEIKWYDKRHLFTLSGEHKHYAAGENRLIVDYKGFKICPLICYDLRFPVFSRNTENYDVLIYVANWPKPRVTAWDILLKARAVENMCYVIGVNRIGSDHNKHDYVGHSQVVNFLGEYILEPQEADSVFIVELDKIKLMETREKLAFLNDRDSFKLI